MASARASSLIRMRASDMRAGQEYELQRSPGRRVRRVTLISTKPPSGRSHWVLVRFEDGISAGTEKEVSSQSIYPLSDAEPLKRRKRKKPERVVPPGWMPTRGEAVAWTQTLGSRCTVLAVDAQKGVARIEGIVLGMEKQFDAPVSELSPYEQPELVVHEGELQTRLDHRLPVSRIPQKDNKPEPSHKAERGPNAEIVGRLVFSAKCINAYRRRFARNLSKTEAERRLRRELEYDARRVRSNPKEYVRLQVEDRFEVPLRKRPAPLKPTHVERLIFAAKSQRNQRRKAA